VHSLQEVRITYEMDGAMGRSLVGLLTEEEKALAGLGSPGVDVMGNVGNLIGLECADRLSVNRLGAEPEEFLGVEEVPKSVR
jgi:hypothetical protein